MNSHHSFEKKLACKVGIEKSLLLGRIQFFVEYNQQNMKNYRDGNYWMYDSSSALQEVYPYLNASSIRRWMVDLEKEGWIESGNFNRRANDLTKWYTMGKKFINYLKEEGDKLPDQNDQPTLSHDQNSLFDEELAAQNDQVNELPDQNERPAAQNDQSIAQNDQPLPIIAYSKPNVAVEEEKKPVPAPPGSVEKEIPDLDSEIGKLFITYFSKTPHFSLVDDIKKTIVMDQSDRTNAENLRIARDAFAQATRQDKCTVAYVLKTIEGMKRDIATKKEKDEALKKKEEIQVMASNTNPNKWKGTFNDITGGKNKYLDEPTAEPIKKIPVIDKDSEEYKRKKKEFEQELSEAIGE
jgi:hypothetical protein